MFSCEDSTSSCAVHKRKVGDSCRVSRTSCLGTRPGPMDMCLTKQTMSSLLLPRDSDKEISRCIFLFAAGLHCVTARPKKRGGLQEPLVGTGTRHSAMRYRTLIRHNVLCFHDEGALNRKHDFRLNTVPPPLRALTERPILTLTTRSRSRHPCCELTRSQLEIEPALSLPVTGCQP